MLVNTRKYYRYPHILIKGRQQLIVERGESKVLYRFHEN